MFLKSAALVSVFSFAGTALAVELHEATNEQLLSELSRRLSQTPPAPVEAFASYMCNPQYEMKIELVAESGSAVSESVYLGASCGSTAQKLTEKRSRITKTTVIAVCTPQYSLIKYSLTPAGALKKISDTYIGSGCSQQADQINNR